LAALASAGTIRGGSGRHVPWLVVYYWKVIISVRLSVGAFGFKGSLVRLPLP
jgi:hypothetical protein